jgi:hypothetical protein
MSGKLTTIEQIPVEWEKFDINWTIAAQYVREYPGYRAVLFDVNQIVISLCRIGYVSTIEKYNIYWSTRRNSHLTCERSDFVEIKYMLPALPGVQISFEANTIRV